VPRWSAQRTRRSSPHTKAHAPQQTAHITAAITCGKTVVPRASSCWGVTRTSPSASLASASTRWDIATHRGASALRLFRPPKTSSKRPSKDFLAARALCVSRRRRARRAHTLHCMLPDAPPLLPVVLSPPPSSPQFPPPSVSHRPAHSSAALVTFVRGRAAETPCLGREGPGEGAGGGCAFRVHPAAAAHLLSKALAEDLERGERRVRLARDRVAVARRLARDDALLVENCARPCGKGAVMQGRPRISGAAHAHRRGAAGRRGVDAPLPLIAVFARE